MAQHLEKIQSEKGWDVILIVNHLQLFDGKPSLTPVNLYFPFPTTFYHLKKYLPTLINNPRFNVVKWYRTITPDYNDNSCSPSKYGETDVNIFFDNAISTTFLMILQNVIFNDKLLSFKQKCQICFALETV